MKDVQKLRDKIAIFRDRLDRFEKRLDGNLENWETDYELR